jgi:6-pyruvoyltetrahydropterin/6-carboxytetrahydropterin synthase
MTLTRRYRFAASHRLNTPALTTEENSRLYGKCNNPYGHGHDYVLDVSVAGPVDASGQIVNRDALDTLVQERVIGRLDHRNLNCDVPELRDAVATTENLASAIEAMLTSNWTLPAALAGVRISETARNTFELKARPTTTS